MRRLSSILLLVLMATLLGTSLAAQKKTHTSARLTSFTIETPDPEKIRAHVKFLASDLLEGRGTGQRGGAIAAESIATPFELYALNPASPKSNYFIDLPMMGGK